ncbi:MAG: FAD-binding protein [Phycisphaerae bacterium]|nr:FAD-binding protein [Phycisphaerae bacterium]
MTAQKRRTTRATPDRTDIMRENLPDPQATAAIDELRSTIAGDVWADALSRALYATDASIYQIVPDGVVLPRSVGDVIATVRACARHGVPLTARGAGTGLTGGAVNGGLQLDCSRYLNRVLTIDADRRTAKVEPGVVLDELNAELKPYGLHFAPDVATGSRATIGGMIANNSCGARSVLFGRTVDHVLSLDVVLSDGSTCTWGPDVEASRPARPPAAGKLWHRRLAGDSTGETPVPQFSSRAAKFLNNNSVGSAVRTFSSDNPLARRCEETLVAVARDLAGEIAERYPKVLRCNGGYALDRLQIKDGRTNPETIVCGSEGTLCLVVGATLKLTPLPKHKGLVIVHFDDLPASLAATPAALSHSPAAVELVDKLILDTARANPATARRCSFIQGDPQAILIVELYDDDADELARRLQAVVDDLKARSIGCAWPVLTNPDEQADVWQVRKSGLGLLMSRPGDRQPYAFVEDTAVEPARLRDYIERFRAILLDEHVEQVGYYAHASAGCLHVRPVLNLKRRDDVERMQRIADRVSSLALEFGGTMTGEHGDGIVRSCWLGKMYGPRIVEAFGKIKRAFDPHGLLNPGKIVSPLPMTDNLRYESEKPRTSVAEEPRASAHAASASASGRLDTVLDFSTHGGMAGLAGMCSGVGQCRQRLVGTMCPSYMATGDEKHSTRGRANALRVALSDCGLLNGLSDPAIDEVMDLCLSCKACRTECPTGVDMARLKAEWLNQRHLRLGAPRRSRLIAAVAELAPWGCRFAPVSNWLVQSRWMRALMERLFGLDRRVPPPRFARQTFRKWLAHQAHGSQSVAGGLRSVGSSIATPDASASSSSKMGTKPQVVYFLDTWTNCYTPQVGMAAVKVLDALGYDVIVPPTKCCGRPAISKGLLAKAKRLATANVAVLAPYAAAGIPIVGTEPSCLLTLVDEYPQLVRTQEARQIARMAVTIESFVSAILKERPDALRFKDDRPPLRYHGHCHQKSLIGTEDTMALLTASTHGKASEIDSGCCGMAGSFGHEVEHYDVARTIGEQRLFPAIRSRGDAEIAVSGFSCRHHIEHHTGADPRHVVEYIADALA